MDTRSEPQPATERRARAEHPTYAKAIRVLAQVLVVALAWGTFLWSWVRVALEIDRRVVARGLVVVAISLLANVTLVALWVRHNLGIYRRRHRRTSSPVLPPVLERDFLGIKLMGDWEALREAPAVRVAVEGRRKTFVETEPEAFPSGSRER